MRERYWGNRSLSVLYIFDMNYIETKFGYLCWVGGVSVVSGVWCWISGGLSFSMYFGKERVV